MVRASQSQAALGKPAIGQSARRHLLWLVPIVAVVSVAVGATQCIDNTGVSSRAVIPAPRTEDPGVSTPSDEAASSPSTRAAQVAGPVEASLIESTQPLFRTRKMEDADAEMARIGRQYSSLLYARREQPTRARRIAKDLVLRCISVKLAAQGRAEHFMPNTADGMGAIPVAEQHEVVFLTGSNLYRVDKSEFPVLLRLEQPASLGDSSSGPSASLDHPMPPELLAEVELFMNSVLSELSRVAQNP